MLILVIVLRHIILATAVSISIIMIILCAERVKIVLNTRRHHLPLRGKNSTRVDGVVVAEQHRC